MLGQVDLMVGPHVSNFMKFMLEELASPQSLSSFIYSPNHSSVIYSKVAFLSDKGEIIGDVRFVFHTCIK